MIKPAPVALLSSMLLLSPQLSLASDKPPADAKPLSAIATQLEQQGYSPIAEMEFDDGRWKVEAYKDNQKRKLRVDPVTGKVLSEKPHD